MSGRREKEKRRLLKAKQVELLQHMKPENQNPRNQDLGIQVINFLENFVQLHTTLTGVKPESITLTDVMYNAYQQEALRHSEVLGLKPEFKSEEMSFNGMKLLKKSPLIVPEGVTTPPIAVGQVEEKPAN